MFTSVVRAPIALSRPPLITVRSPRKLLRLSFTSTPSTIRRFRTIALSDGYLDFTRAATPDTYAADTDVPLALVYQFEGSVSGLHKKQFPWAWVVNTETPGAAIGTV